MQGFAGDEPPADSSCARWLSCVICTAWLSAAAGRTLLIRCEVPGPVQRPVPSRIVAGLKSLAMRFGLFIPQGWRMDLVGIDPQTHWSVMRDLATYADNGAWDSLWVYDHFHTVPVPTAEATHEAWSLMSAYAATTSRIKLGQMCTAMSYRNPVYLAKVAATADIISGGRIQMGIGGGWYEHEWRAYGYGFPSAGVRLGRLDESVQIMRDAWPDGKDSFDRMAGYVPEEVADAVLSGGSEGTTGTTEQVIERIAKVRDLGCEYAIVYFPEAAYDRSGIELFERDVIPALS